MTTATTIMADAEHEKAIIATALIERARHYLADILSLKPDDFYFAHYRTYFTAIRDLETAGIDVSLLTVYNRLQKVKGQEAAAAFMDEFAACQYYNPTTIKYVIDEVRNYARKRELRNICLDVAQEVEKPGASADELVMRVDAGARAIVEGGAGMSLSFGDSGLGWERFNKKVISTGMPFLDEVIRGFQPSQLIVIAARPGEGKTSFALNIALHVAQTAGVLFFTFEMDVDELELRELCIEAQIEMETIARGQMTDEEVQRFADAERSLSARKLKIVDAPLNLAEMIAEMRREYMRGNLGLVVVDYLQLVSVGGKKDRHLEVAEISRTLKLEAKRMKIPVVALAQLSRIAADQEPQLHHLRESGAIEQDANMVIFIHKPVDSDIHPDYRNVIIAKNRQGRVGKKDVLYNKRHQRFTGAA